MRIKQRTGKRSFLNNGKPLSQVSHREGKRKRGKRNYAFTSPPSGINSSLVQQLQPLQNKFYKARKAYENNGSWKRNPDAVVASYDKFALPSGISDEKLALNDPAVRAYRANITREQANTKYGYK